MLIPAPSIKPSGRRGEIRQPKSRPESNRRRRGKFSLQMALEELWRCHLLLDALDCNLLIVVSGALYIRSGSLSECIDPRSGLKNPIKCVAARRWRWGSGRGHIPPEARLFSLQLSVHPVLYSGVVLALISTLSPSVRIRDPFLCRIIKEAPFISPFFLSSNKMGNRWNDKHTFGAASTHCFISDYCGAHTPKQPQPIDLSI